MKFGRRTFTGLVGPVLVTGAMMCTALGSQSIAHAASTAMPAYAISSAGSAVRAAQTAGAPVLIDDFTTGPYTGTLTDEGQPAAAYQGGAAIIGGARNTVLTNGFDPRHTPVTLDVGSDNRLNLTVGPGQEVRFDLSYGHTPGAQQPLDLDITPYRAFVVHFHSVGALPGYYPLWAMLLHSGTSYSQAGDWILGGPEPFAMEIPLSSFMHFAGSDDRHVNFITFIVQSKIDVAIDSIELV